MSTKIIPVGITEIATLLGVERDTADSWRPWRRNLLPDPLWTVGNRPAWNWADVARWAKETNRLPDKATLASRFAALEAEHKRTHCVPKEVK